jgi:predicted kinase
VGGRTPAVPAYTGQGMEAAIFIGIQGAGKTTFYRRRFADTHVRLSLDMLRTRARERILLEACLRAGQPFVVDNTNVRASERAACLAAARAAGCRTAAYFFVPELRASIARNNAREGKPV